MDKQQVKEIFSQKKIGLLRGLISQDSPIAFILGGQPASGKSKLANSILAKYPDKNFLFVNGDVYREFHPDYDSLIKNPHTYSENTQIFSNLFTEELIKEAIQNKYNIIVEGTMRNPQVPLDTANLFRQNGFRVEAYAIAAPALFTEMGLYIRYQEEINIQGWGRLAEITSHNNAVKGILQSLDTLYTQKSVDSIHLYTYQASELILTYTLKDNGWDNSVQPSSIVKESRQNQLKHLNPINYLTKKGKLTILEIEEKLKPEIDKLLLRLENLA